MAHTEGVDDNAPPHLWRNESLMEEAIRPMRDHGARINGRLVEMKGTMYKLSLGLCTPDGRCFVTKWNKRFFVLFEGDTVIKYWKTKNQFLFGNKHKGEIDLTERYVGQPSQSVNGKDKNDVWCLYHPTKGDRYFSPEDPKTTTEWITAVSAQFQRMKGASTLDDFEVKALLGVGGFGKVYLVRHKSSNMQYAMKVMRKSHVVATRNITSALEERKVMVAISHPFIVNLRYTFHSYQRLFFVMDFVQGGELFNELQKHVKFEEGRARLIGAEVALALMYLHHVGILYRDLKPENILITREGNIKIADFGLAKMQDELERKEKRFSMVGSPYYMAPEILQRTGHDKECDWWSLGVLIFEMLVGWPPFYDKNMHTAISNLVSRDVEIPQGISVHAGDLLRKLLQRDPTQRLGSSGALAIKAHEWWNRMDWESMQHGDVVCPEEWRPTITGDDDLRYFKDVVHPARSTGHTPLSPETQAAFDDFDFTSSSTPTSGCARSRQCASI